MRRDGLRCGRSVQVDDQRKEHGHPEMGANVPGLEEMRVARGEIGFAP